MHVLTVIAENLSPEHLLAAVKHWAAKFEQEILNTDTGPSERGAYEFEHDGVPTAVHWNPASTVNHMQPSTDQAGYLMDYLSDEDIEKLKASGGASAGYIMTGKVSPNFKPDPDLHGNEESLLPQHPDDYPEKRQRRDDDTVTRPVAPATDTTNPAETAQQMGETPGATAADVAAAVAPDLV